jgi:hypothetical protein
MHPLDDDDWIDLLAGRAAPDSLRATRQEAAWLRAALLAYRAQAPAGTVPDPAQRIERLLARARRAGLLEPRRATSSGWPPGGRGAWISRWFARWGGGAWRLGAGLAMAALLAVLWWPPAADDDGRVPVLRGAAVQQFEVADPAAEARRVQQALQAAGFEVLPYALLGRRGLDVTLDHPLSERRRQALRQLGLQAPPGPTLRLEYLPRAETRP